MALYQIDVEKQIGTETWTNVYYADAADNAAAAAIANQIIAAERPIHFTSVNFTLFRVRLAGTNHVGARTSVGLLGTRSSATALLPLFNCCRVDIPNGQARPVRKYLRGTLNSGDVAANYQILSTTVTLLTNYCTALAAISGLRDPQNRTLFTGVPSLFIAMHQLRRGNRKKPVI